MDETFDTANVHCGNATRPGNFKLDFVKKIVSDLYFFFIHFIIVGICQKMAMFEQINKQQCSIHILRRPYMVIPFTNPFYMMLLFVLGPIVYAFYRGVDSCLNSRGLVYSVAGHDLPPPPV